MSDALAVQNAALSESQIDLVKRTVAKGTTNDELALFLYQSNRTGLDPLCKQIYCIKRKQKQEDGSYKEVATIQTGIDGFRVIAERTGNYAPGDTTWQVDEKGNLISATASVLKRVGDKWFTITATAFYPEYGQGNHMWQKMPRQMLAKCAESLALRKAFPMELSGLYTHEEMQQADTEIVAPSGPIEPTEIIDAPQTGQTPSRQVDKPRGQAGKKASEKQIDRLYTIAKKTGISKTDLDAWVLSKWGCPVNELHTLAHKDGDTWVDPGSYGEVCDELQQTDPEFLKAEIAAAVRDAASMQQGNVEDIDLGDDVPFVDGGEGA